MEKVRIQDDLYQAVNGQWLQQAVIPEFRGETLKEYTRKDKDEEIEYKLPFGGGAGAGVSINPVAFLVVQPNNVKLLPVEHCSAIDRLLDYVPDLMEKANIILNKNIQNKKEEMKNQFNQL